MEYEKVQIVNNGACLVTCIISGFVCLNRAAARLVQPGDNFIIAYAMMSDEEARNHMPKIAFLNDNNYIDGLIGTEPANTIRQNFKTVELFGFSYFFM